MFRGPQACVQDLWKLMAPLINCIWGPNGPLNVGCNGFLRVCRLNESFRKHWYDQIQTRKCFKACTMTYITGLCSACSYASTWWKHFLCCWPFVRPIQLVDSPHKGQWRGALVFPLICAWTNGWANNQDAGDWRCHHTNYCFTVISLVQNQIWWPKFWLPNLVAFL